MNMRFGDDLQDYFVSIVFGNGVFALRGVVLKVADDYLVLRTEKENAIAHVPFANILYLKLGAKFDA